MSKQISEKAIKISEKYNKEIESKDNKLRSIKIKLNKEKISDFKKESLIKKQQKIELILEKKAEKHRNIMNKLYLKLDIIPKCLRKKNVLKYKNKLINNITGETDILENGEIGPTNGRIII